MTYNILTIGPSDELFIKLKTLVPQCELRFTASYSIREANELLIYQVFHLLIVDLEYLRSIQQTNWLFSLRRSSYVPIIVLSSTPEQDLVNVIELGADICISRNCPYAALAELAYAQLRRYTEYNHLSDPKCAEAAPFREGDIYIDPPRRVVEVRGQPVELRPREFSLLLYFMQNPDIVLTSEQICEQAWGMEEGYNHGVSHPIYLLRKAIEPDPENPVYIQTVRRVGYRFLPNKTNISQ